MKKRLLSLLLVMMMLITAMPLAAAQSTNNYKVDWLVQNNIVQGRGDGELSLGKNITRAEFTKMVLAVTGELNQANLYAAASAFKDVNNHWAKNFIAYATQRGYLAGYQDGSFRPNAPIKLDECIAILARLNPDFAEPKVKTGYWAQAYIDYAKTSGILNGIANTNNLKTFATRETAFNMVYNEVQVYTFVNKKIAEEARRLLEEDAAKKEEEAREEEARQAEARKARERKERRERQERREREERLDRYYRTEYNVYFNLGSGYVFTDRLLANTFYKLPLAPSVAPSGKKFKAWSVNGTICNEGAYALVDGDLYISPVWEVITTPPTPNPPATTKYTVKFITDYGTKPADQKVEEGKMPKKPEDLTADGYDFKGWYLEEACTNKYEFNTAVTRDLTLYAKWEVKKYTVSFNLKGHGTDIGAKEVKHGEKVTAPTAPTDADFNFDGWYKDEELRQEYNFETAVTSDLKLYAKWTAKVVPPTPDPPAKQKFTVTAEGAIADPEQAAEGDNVKVTAKDIADKEFVEWETNDFVIDGRLKKTTPLTFKMPAKNVTIKAVFKAKAPAPITYKVTAIEATTTLRSAEAGASVTVTPLTKTGMVFDKWKAEGLTLTDEQKIANQLTFEMPANEVKITATFKPEQTPQPPVKQKHTVTFDYKGHGTNTKSEVNSGDKVTAPTPAPTAEGFSFDGWYKDEELSQAYDFETAVTDNITLYAKWTKKEYTVTFDYKGKGTNARSKVKYGDKVTAPTPAPTAEGFDFEGWYKDEEFNQVYNFDTAVTDNLKLYAKWTAINYNIRIDQNIKHGTVTSATTSKFGEKVKLEIKANENYEVDTISVKDSKDQPIAVEDDNTFIMPSSDVTIVVTFKVKEYQIKINTFENGKVEVKAKAKKDELVELKITANDGYKVDTITVTDSNKNPITVSNTNTFTMPASNVTVNATFKKKTAEEIAVDELLDKAKNFESTIELKIDTKSSTSIDFNKLLENVSTSFKDRISGTYLQSTIVGSYHEARQVGTTINIKFEITYHHNKAQEVEVNNYVDNFIRTKITDAMSDYDKIEAVHDYIITNAAYVALIDNGNNTVSIPEKNPIGISVHSPYALSNSDNTKNIGVCQAYAALFQKFMDKLGIECYYAIGNAGGPHAWNLVKVEGKYYNIDLTYDDPVDAGRDITVQNPPKSDFENYEYFLRGDRFFNNPGEHGIPHTRDNLKNITVEENDYEGRADGKLYNTQNANQISLDSAA